YNRLVKLEPNIYLFDLGLSTRLTIHLFNVILAKTGFNIRIELLREAYPRVRNFLAVTLGNRIYFRETANILEILKYSPNEVAHILYEKETDAEVDAEFIDRARVIAITLKKITKDAQIRISTFLSNPLAMLANTL